MIHRGDATYTVKSDAIKNEPPNGPLLFHFIPKAQLIYPAVLSILLHALRPYWKACS